MHFSVKYVLIALSGSVIVQIIKVISSYIINKKINLQRFVETGGMPSSHSAAATTMTTLVGIEAGFDSLIFNVTLFFSLVIMYDAAGLRRAAGRQATILNKIIDDLQLHKHIQEKRLRELLGHTPLEVIAGAIFGVVYAFAWY